jgi:CheY-like chemotaxis protein
LVVEDEVLVLDLVQGSLEDAGYAVVAINDAAGALEFLASHAARLCALITDINLGPPPSGWCVARRARELSPDLPVVYVSGDSAHGWAREGVAASRLVHKPFAPDELLAVLGELLQKAPA